MYDTIMLPFGRSFKNVLEDAKKFANNEHATVYVILTYHDSRMRPRPKRIYIPYDTDLKWPDGASNLLLVMNGGTTINGWKMAAFYFRMAAVFGRGDLPGCRMTAINLQRTYVDILGRAESADQSTLAKLQPKTGQ